MTAAQILIVEDESLIAMGIEMELKSMGYGVTGVASSGEEALRLAVETPPDLVLMDVVLKGEMDGVDTAEELQEWLDVPVVYLTAYSDDPTLKRAKVTRPYGYLVKPYEERELRTTIEVTLYRHRLEAIEKEMQRWRAAILRSIGDAVVVTDAPGWVRVTNRVAEKLTGWSDEDAFGQSLDTIVHLIDEATRRDLPLPPAEVLLGGKTVAVAEGTLLVARDGRKVPVEGAFSALENERGGFGGRVVVLRDVTERRQAAEALRRRDQQLRWLQKMESVGRLAGGMARDFGEMLSTISGDLAQVLAHFPENDSSRERLAATENLARDVAEGVRHLLASTRRVATRPEPVHFNALLQSMLELLRQAIDPRVTLEFKPGPDLWEVQADPVQMSEMVMILCLSAQRAMPKGGKLFLETENVVLADYLSPLPEFQRGEFVRLRISDTGGGIPSVVTAHPYEPLFAANGSYKGTGLGVALVFDIVEQNRGWIDCHGEGAEGTHFEVYLPRRSPDDLAARGNEG